MQWLLRCTWWRVGKCCVFWNSSWKRIQQRLPGRVWIPLDACALRNSCAACLLYVPLPAKTHRLRFRCSSAGQLESWERRGPTVIKEVTNDHVMEHNSDDMNRAANPQKGCCSHPEELKKDWAVFCYGDLCAFTMWGSAFFSYEVLMMIINLVFIKTLPKTIIELLIIFVFRLSLMSNVAHARIYCYLLLLAKKVLIGLLLVW